MTSPRSLLPRPLVFAFAVFLLATCSAAFAAASAPLKVLFLGGPNGSHEPTVRLRELAPPLIARGIQLVYTDDVAAALTLENLKRYDALIIFANIDTIAPEQDQALFDYVTQGGGFVPLHSASYCFRNSERYVALVGGQFRRHDPITAFTTKIIAPDNPLMQGFGGVVSTGDEPYVHTKHNEQNRTVLEMRGDEPYTWTRTEGKGRVFYTAWGHDARTWTNPGFHDLVERGIRFAVGQKLPDSLAKTPAVTPFEYEEGLKVPFYSNDPGAAPRGANPWPRVQKPLTPAQSMQHIVVPAGFELQLFASEPDIKKPVAMAWDERGRLWIIETVDYPNRLLAPDEPGNDRIVICEDTNRDGKADKFTVFADGLNIPTSLIFSNGGVIVQQMPNAFFMKDTNGDDKADIKEVLMTGWGRRDTHAGPSNMVYGPDNWIWGVVGYSGFNGTVGGKPYSFAQAFYRFKPDGSAMEFLRNTNNNTWGIGVSESGILFASTANNNPSTFMPIPARFYEPAGLTAGTLATIADTSRYIPITTKFREVDVFGGYTAAAGHALYTARAYPKEYWNRVAFVTEPTGHLVGQFNIEPDGANFRAHNPTNLFASDDEWSAPIMAEVGPDGSVWVIDWYNYIIQHNPTPIGFQTGAGAAYENELRDKRHGRIYRVVWKDGKPSQQPNLQNASPDVLVQALTNDNLFWRRHAQRLLVERGRKDVIPALIALTKTQSVDEVGLNVGATHAIWTLQGLNALDSNPAALNAVTEALRHPAPGVRRSAVAVLPRTAATANALATANLLQDGDAQVRLAAMLTLAESPEVPAAGQALHAALAAQKVSLDRWSADAAKMAATSQSKSFLAAATPEEIAAARAAQNQGTRSLLSSATLAAGTGLPANWELVKTNGEVAVARADISRAGKNSLRVDLQGAGASGGASTKLKLKRNYRYEVTGWIKTEGLPNALAGARAGAGGGGRGQAANAGGATLSVPQAAGRAGGGGGGAQAALVRSTTDWTQVRLQLTTANSEDVTLVSSVSLGAAESGVTQGTAWFEDISIREVGPADDSVIEPLNAVLNHLSARNAASGKLTAEPPVPDNTIFTLILGTLPDVMKYDRAEITVKAGSVARLGFRNTDHMPHNVVVVRPGTVEAIGLLADKMLTDPQGLAKNYIPASPDVLFSTPLVNPNENFDLVFTAPAAPGRYPIVCTFPGHWRIMQATLVVTP
ncbi:MAG: PVC-type heme-binding CxxCH protein [Opitutaceae bacterium]